MDLETKLGYKNKYAEGKFKFWPAYICFIVFGFLNSFGKDKLEIKNLLLSIGVSVILAVVTVYMLVLMLNAFNSKLRKETEGKFAKEAVEAGMLFMIPFTILAVLAKFGLGWTGVMPFASAGITTATAVVGTEVMKKGAKGIKNVIIPSLLAFLISTVWMLLIAKLL